MNSLSALPRIGERLISRRTYITRNQRVHSLCGYISCRLTCARDLSDLGVENSLLVRVDFKSCENIDFLYQQERGVFLSQLLSYFSQQPGRLRVLISLSIELDGLHLLILFNQMRGILIQQLLYLDKAMLFRKLHCQVPLVEQYTAIDGFLRISELSVSIDGLFA